MDEKQLRENVKSENSLSADSQDSKFEFITETIKEKPINKKRLVVKSIFTCILALVFGVIASFTFVSLEPIFKNWLYPEDKMQLVTLGGDEDIVNNNQGNNGLEIVSDNSVSDNCPDNENNVPEEMPVIERKTEVITKVETVEKSLELSDYTELYKKISDVAAEAKKSMVVVTGRSSNTDWFMNIYEDNNSTSGLIVADNGKELLILTRTSVVDNSDSILVTFCDGTSEDAVVKKSDVNTDLSIIAVNLEDIPKDTLSEIKMAELGNSKSADIDGSPVIALGDPLGMSDSMAFGQITSHASVKDMVDTNVTVLTTDIYGSTSASGVLINFQGKVLGIVTTDVAGSDTKNLIKGYAISDLKDKIEKISNGQEIAYLGIVGLDVTEEAVEDYGVPKGAYVKQVVIDSPAMQAGIQNGDVIVKLGTTDITSFTDFKDTMLKCQPGDQMMVTVKRLGRDEYVELSYEIALESQNY